MDESKVHDLIPTTELEEGERVIARFQPDPATYWRNQAILAAIAMIGGMAVLWAIGNAYIWAGAVGGLGAIGFRSWFIASDELGTRWDLTNQRLLGPGGRVVALGNLSKVQGMGSAVQIVTVAGDKHLIKYLPNTDDALAEINAACEAM